MMKRAVTLVVACVAFTGGDSGFGADATEVGVKPEQFTLRAVDTDAGPQVQLDDGDLVLQMTKLVLHSGNERLTEIRSVNGRIQMTRGELTISASKIVLLRSAIKVGAKPEQFTLRAVDTHAGPQVQLDDGDLVLQTTKLVFYSGNGRSTVIRSVNGRVQMTQGKRTISASKIVLLKSAIR
jgi:hypothetical protein